MVFFRDDFEPLHPKQARVLWEFCDRLVFGIYPTLQFLYPWATSEGEDVDQGKKFDEVVGCITRHWMEQCTVDNFSAFFDWYRNSKLLKGSESWRSIRSLCDPSFDGGN